MKKNKKIANFWEEFKAFAIKGNAMALAVGTIIGAAFSNITKSLTNDIIMPVVNIFLGGADFTQAKVALPRMPWVEPTYETIVNAAGAEIVHVNQAPRPAGRGMAHQLAQVEVAVAERLDAREALKPHVQVIACLLRKRRGGYLLVELVGEVAHAVGRLAEDLALYRHELAEVLL